jgi:protease I
VLFVIYEQFHESEYGLPRTILEDNGAVVVVAASSPDVVAGHQSMEVQPDVVLGDVDAADYDAIVFIGGFEYNRDDPEAQRIAQQAAAEGRLLAAICIAPITLAKAGVVEGKRVTSSFGAYEMEAAGAIFVGGAVQRDGLIITANGPGASRQFGRAIAAALDE